MTESENVKRCLEQAAGIAKEHILVLEDDVSCLNYQLSQERKKNVILADAVYFSDGERELQKKKSETSLQFMFWFGCMSAVAIAYSILNCQ